MPASRHFSWRVFKILVLSHFFKPMHSARRWNILIFRLLDLLYVAIVKNWLDGKLIIPISMYFDEANLTDVKKIEWWIEFCKFWSKLHFCSSKPEDSRNFELPKVMKIAHTGSNFILIVVARAISNFSKNDTFLISRIWKMGRNLFSSLAIKDNLKVAYLEKNQVIQIYIW